VYGFLGTPDTHALLTYLSWKKIPYVFENINPLKISNILGELPCDSNTIHDLPVTCLDPENQVYVNGSAELISFIETKENYERENLDIDWEEISSLYPKVQGKFHFV